MPGSVSVTARESKIVSSQNAKPGNVFAKLAPGGLRVVPRPRCSKGFNCPQRIDLGKLGMAQYDGLSYLLA
jgi:hypothetical protein